MTELTAVQAQEIEASGEYGSAPLLGVDLRIKPVGRWRPSHLRALRTADYDTWAAGVLHEDDVKIFMDLDATFDEINEFTGSAMESVGELPKKRSGPSVSSTRARKK